MPIASTLVLRCQQDDLHEFLHQPCMACRALFSMYFYRIDTSVKAVGYMYNAVPMYKYVI